MDIVNIDNSSPNDNWITNKTNIEITVACEEMFGSFKIDLRPGESKRVTYDIKANAYPLGKYSYDDLKYQLGKSQKWEVRLDQGVPVLVNPAAQPNIEPKPEQQNENTTEIKCAKCNKNFVWDEAYNQQDTPGSSSHNPPGHGEFRPRAFCPHCGFMVAEWDIDQKEDRNRWKWYGQNKKLNAGKKLPPSPLNFWGKSIPLKVRGEVSDEQIDLLKMQEGASNENFLNAAASGDVATVKNQISAGADINVKSYRGETAVMLAAMKGHTEVVKTLIEAGVDINDQNVYGRHTPLILAALQGHLDTVKALIDSGADKSLKNQFGKTAEDAANDSGHSDIVNIITGRVVETISTAKENLIEDRTIGDAHFNYTGFWKRFGATLIDLTIIIYTSTALFHLCLYVATGISYSNADAAKRSYWLFAFLFGWLYYSIFESSTIQGTPGKMAVRIKVTDLEGQKVGFGKATGRFFGKIISLFVLLFGFIMVAFTQKKQGLHDKMSGCVVVNK